MTLHRFMSKREYDALMTGEVLRNDTDHGSMGQKTDSVGFCFFPEPPDEAIHWLSFIVDADVCVHSVRVATASSTASSWKARVPTLQQREP